MIESQPRRVTVEPFTDESEARRCSLDQRYYPAMFFSIRGKSVICHSSLKCIHPCFRLHMMEVEEEQLGTVLIIWLWR